MACRIRTFDWAETPLGSMASWPQSLRTAVDIMLTMPGPATILWGPVHIQLYNDAYIAIARDRHPDLLGRPVANNWPDVHDEVIAPLLAAVQAGQSTQLLDFPVTLRAKDSSPEERVFNTAWSPICNEEGATTGVLQTLTEVTAGHQARAALRAGEERHAFLLVLSDALRSFGDVPDIKAAAARLLGMHLGADLTLWWQTVGESGSRAAAVCGEYARDGVPLSAHRSRKAFPQVWTLQALSRGKSIVIDDVERDAALSETTRAVWRSIGVRASIVATLGDVCQEGVYLGVLQGAPRQWSPDEVNLVREVVERTWAAVERARAETALRESEIRFRGLVEGFGQFSWEAAADGRIIADSEGWRAHTGQNPSEWLGYGWLNAIHPDERADTERKWREAVATGRAVDSEYRLWHAPSATWRWSNVRAVPITDPSGAILRWAGVNIDINDRRALRARLEVLVHELQHRTRNLLDVVDGIARQTLEHTGPSEQFITQFNDRLAALARVQELLARSDERRITIGDIVHLELDALAADLGSDRIRVAGPEVGLRSAVVQTIALALHELATNARKYGVLAGDRGELHVTWSLVENDGRPWLLLDWVERGLSPLRETAGSATRGGYGRELIEEALPYALGARTCYRFDGASIRCEIALPLDQVGKEDIA